jgi:hypothetical protein
MKNVLYTTIFIFISVATSAQVFNFYGTNYYLLNGDSVESGSVLTSAEMNLSGFNFSNAPADHPLFTTGVFFPIQDCSNQNLWIRVQHIAADPNGIENGHAVTSTLNSPFLPQGSTDRIGGWYGFYYEFQIYQDEVLQGERNYTLGSLFPTGITVASLETLYNDGGVLFEWLAFEILNEETSGWYLNSTNFTGINPLSTPGFSSELFYSTTGTANSAPIGFSTDFPNGSDSIYAVDMNLSSSYHSEFKMSAAGVSKFRYGYEFTTGGYQGMSMEFGVPPVANAIVHPSCGINTGEILLEVTGTEPITFEWSNESSSSSVTNLAPGPYDVIITDANGCSISQSFSIPEFDPFSAVINVTDNEGVITLDAILTGGSGDFTYDWNTGESTSSIVVLEPGDYTVEITDINGCFAWATATIVSVEENTKSARVAVSPNPSNGEIRFAIAGPATGLIISNSFGQIIHELQITNNNAPVTLNLNLQESGIYFYSVLMEGNLRKTGKIVVFN